MLPSLGILLSTPSDRKRHRPPSPSNSSDGLSPAKFPEGRKEEVNKVTTSHKADYVKQAVDEFLLHTCVLLSQSSATIHTPALPYNPVNVAPKFHEFIKLVQVSRKGIQDHHALQRLQEDYMQQGTLILQ